MKDALLNNGEAKETKEQRCWVHKIKDVLDKCPKSLKHNVKSQLHEMMMAPNEEISTKVKNNFKKGFEDKYPKTVGCLTKNWEEMMMFYSMPAASCDVVTACTVACR